MSIGGTCWYRILPGFEGTDPISLTTAVVQVADLLADVALDRPVLLGWGQGAVVALAAALWRPGSVQSLVCVDASRAHVDLLPRAVLDAPSTLPVLLAATDGPRRAELEGLEEFLSGRKVATTTWQWAGEGTPHDLDEALAEQIGKWMGQARHAQ
jgi:pimeloyl-ACP methyl ester carboxylesterase